MPVKKLIEHPENGKLFKDIAETNPAFWLEFKNSIKEFGIIEPLIVNEKTMQIRSGNQRLKAVLELGIENVPVVFVPDEIPEEEVRKMIASNVFRRSIDPFAMFSYIGMLRRGHDGKTGVHSELKSGMSKEEVRQTTKKSPSFVSAADIFNSLTEEQKAELKQKFYSNGAMNEGKLVAQLREMEAEALAKEADIKELFEKVELSEGEIETLQGMIDERDTKIEELRNLDIEEEIEDRDLQIRKLTGEKAKLKKKINKMQEPPDINAYLLECTKRQAQTNSILKEILDNRVAIKSDKTLQNLFILVWRTVEILKEKAPTQTKKLLEEHIR